MLQTRLNLTEKEANEFVKIAKKFGLQSSEKTSKTAMVNRLIREISAKRLIVQKPDRIADEKSSHVMIRIEAPEPYRGIIAIISRKIGELEINIVATTTMTLSENLARIQFTLEMKDMSKLKDMYNKIINIRGIDLIDYNPKFLNIEGGLNEDNLMISKEDKDFLFNKIARKFHVFFRLGITINDAPQVMGRITTVIAEKFFFCSDMKMSLPVEGIGYIKINVSTDIINNDKERSDFGISDLVKSIEQKCKKDIVGIEKLSIRSQ